MASKWLVHISHNKVLGPWTSQRVREALRRGEVDPFDKVSRVGSNMTQEILEVDEIFQSNTSTPAYDHSTPNWSSSNGSPAELPNPPHHVGYSPPPFQNPSSQAAFDINKQELIRAQAEAKVLAEAKAKLEMEARINAEAHAKANAEARAFEEAKARIQAEAEARARAEAEVRAHVEEQARIKAEAEARAHAEAEARARVEEEARMRIEVEVEVEAEARARAEARAMAEQQARIKAEAHAKAQIENRNKHANMPPPAPKLTDQAFAAAPEFKPVDFAASSNAIASSAARQDEPIQPKGMLALADPSAADEHFLKPKKINFFSKRKQPRKAAKPVASQSSNKQGKNYIAVNPQGYIYGPLNTEDILRNYKDEIFKKDFSIKKGSSSKQIPIEEFIKQKKGKQKIAPAPAQEFKSFDDFAPPAGPSATRNANIGIVLIIIIAIIIGIMTIGVDENAKSPSERRKAKSSITKKQALAPSSRKRVSKKKKTPQVRRSTVKSRDTKKRNNQGPRKVIKKRRPLPKKKVYTKPIVKKRTTFSDSPRVAANNRQPVRRAPATGPVASLRGRNGQKATIGPLSYLPADLNRCSLKCELVMKDQTGTPIRVKFFKGQFEQKLSKRAVNVHITGHVADNGASLLLSGVK